MTPKTRPQRTYKIVCFSLYPEDVENLDRKVAELRRRGHTKANKSQLIRHAIEQVDLDQVPRLR
jgi:cobalamin biosynthesis protein CobD/CbiB